MCDMTSKATWTESTRTCTLTDNIDTAVLSASNDGWFFPTRKLHCPGNTIKEGKYKGQICSTNKFQLKYDINWPYEGYQWIGDTKKNEKVGYGGYAMYNNNRVFNIQCPKKLNVYASYPKPGQVVFQCKK